MQNDVVFDPATAGIGGGSPEAVVERAVIALGAERDRARFAEREARTAARAAAEARIDALARGARAKLAAGCMEGAVEIGVGASSLARTLDGGASAQGPSKSRGAGHLEEIVDAHASVLRQGARVAEAIADRAEVSASRREQTRATFEDGAEDASREVERAERSEEGLLDKLASIERERHDAVMSILRV